MITKRILETEGTTFFSFSYKCICFFIVSVFLLSCKNEINNKNEIEKNPLSVSFERFDLKFYNNSPDVIPNLKNEYPFLFPKQFSDSWITRQRTLQLLLQDAVITAFSDLSFLEKNINLFKYIRHYFPKTKIPEL